ncbi:MAG: sugar ABC transporter ATP-binding protein [Rhizobiales bacterium]|nr:sugar ABC transporter ATP-binding protein [Hyphomicrobiales bacterium]
MAVLLEAKNLTKNYPGTVALRDVSFELRSGEVHCLMGENGAGKSTLIKILAGAVAQDEGDILIEGRSVGRTQVRERRDLGISVIYQDLNLVPQLTVAENIYLGHEPRTALGTVDVRKMNRLSAELIDMLGVAFPVDAKVGDLPIPLQQLTATAKALSLNGRVLIMDEPSTVLSGRDLDVLFDVVRRLRQRGMGIIYITHHLDEVFTLGDQQTDGRARGRRGGVESRASRARPRAARHFFHAASWRGARRRRTRRRRTHGSRARHCRPRRLRFRYDLPGRPATADP